MPKIMSGTKWIISLVAALVFIIVSAPITYKLTNKVSKLAHFETTEDGGPTVFGLLIHTVVFLLLLRLILIWVC